MTTVQLAGIEGRQVTVPTGLFIDGSFHSAYDNATLEVENPTHGTRLATVAAAQKADVDRAVESSQAAWKHTWKHTSPAERGRLLCRLADLVQQHAEELATIEALDVGLLYSESLNLCVSNAVEVLRYFAGWADKIAGQYLGIPAGHAYTQRVPIGVCAAVVPWNTPLMITIWKLAPAMAAGNTLIIKSPELAPLVLQKLATLIQKAGFPKGVINILCGHGTVAGQALAEHDGVKKLAFTGSAAVGRHIMKTAALTNLKKVTLELGGKGPSIVFADANFDNALFWTSLGITANNGQICAAGSRIYVQSSVYERFLQAFSKRCTAAVHGDPLLPEITKGPLVSGVQHQKVLAHIQAGRESGARLLHGGNRLGDRGHFIENTAFADVSDNARLMKEEIFGPVAAIAKFDTEASAIALANDSDYGLSAAVFTENVHRAHRVAAAIECGMVTVNCWGMLNANTPFGGMKQSGFGRDMGEAALEGWTEWKTVKFMLLPEEGTAKL